MGSASMFSGVRTMHISGQPIFQINDEGAKSIDAGIQLLVSRVVKGSMHNSKERFDAPSCHKETRMAIREDILGWADELVDDLNDLVTWLYGPAGSGKSAIAQTIAQELHNRGQLTASFFFSRAGDSGGRGEETNLVATLAYQLFQSDPATRPYISAAVRENPLVFDLALQDQVDVLIVAPLTAVSNASSQPKSSRVIVVDGLDECTQERDAQRHVVNALISGLCQVPHHTHKIFITSRPEYRIVSIFGEYTNKLVRRMELNHAWKPNDDIQAFINSSFAAIRRNHPYFQSHRVDKAWPNPDDVEALVRKSSGQFIYPSVVLKYIKSEENYNPVACLETILQLKQNGDRPYAELDNLYKHVFSQLKGVDRVQVLTILSMTRELQHAVRLNLLSPSRPNTIIFELMGVDSEDQIKFWLRPLVSLLTWTQGAFFDSGLTYMHASLLDFLLDEGRSDVFCIKTPTIASKIVGQAIKLIECGSVLKNPFSTADFLKIPHIYADMLPSDQKFHIHTLVQDFNVVESVLCHMNKDLVNHTTFTTALAHYLNWVLAESENKDASYSQQALLKPVAQIQTWLINQFQRLQINNLDNTKQIDLWFFFTSSFDYHLHDSNNRTDHISGVLSLALEICGPSTGCQLLPGSISYETVALCSLMSNLRTWSKSKFDIEANSWLFRPDLLGQYAVTEERYCEALQHIAYYLLQLPKHILANLFNSDKSRRDIWKMPVIRLIYLFLPTLLEQSLRTTDLYFLVVLTCPIMSCLRPFYSSDHDVLFYLGDVISETQNKFPFLSDSTSYKYVEARAKFEEACIRLKIKTSLHELAHTVPAQAWGPYGMATGEPMQWRKLLGEFANIDKRIP